MDDWLDFVADLLATPLTALPEERIARHLAATFDAVVCAFHARRGDAQPVQRVDPPERYRPEQHEEMHRGTAKHAPRQHPVLRYYTATGASGAGQAADVPSPFAGVPGLERWFEEGGVYDNGHQIALPVLAGPGCDRAFVIGRTQVFSPAEVELAARLQRMLIGLDRQAAVLARSLPRTPATEPAPVAPDVRLTPRELTVLVLVADGHTAAAAARRMRVAERTVHKHLERVYAKLGVSDRVSAVLTAQRIGVLPPSGEQRRAS